MLTFLLGLPVTHSPSTTTTFITSTTTAKDEASTETEKTSDCEEHWFCSGGNDKNILKRVMELVLVTRT